MSRRVAPIVCAITVVASLWAAAPQAAIAGEFMINEGTSEIKLAGGTQTFVTTSGNVVCGEMSGSASEFTSSSITVTNLSYHNAGSTKCNGPFGTSPEVKTEGCHYKLEPGETEEGSVDKTTGSLSLLACTGGGLVVSAPGCTIRFPANQSLANVTFKNTRANSPDDVDMIATPTNTEYTHEGFLCGIGGASNGAYSGEATVTAGDVGVRTNFTIT